MLHARGGTRHTRAQSAAPLPARFTSPGRRGTPSLSAGAARLDPPWGLRPGIASIYKWTELLVLRRRPNSQLGHRGHTGTRTPEQRQLSRLSGAARSAVKILKLGARMSGALPVLVDARGTGARAPPAAPGDNAALLEPLKEMVSVIVNWHRPDPMSRCLAGGIADLPVSACPPESGASC